jgi:hypothetical protein
VKTKEKNLACPCHVQMGGGGNAVNGRDSAVTAVIMEVSLESNVAMVE